MFPDGRLRVYVYPDAFALVPMLFLDYDSVDADPASGKRYHLYTDHLGCPGLVLDDASRNVWKARVDPYGTAHVEVGQDFHQPLRWPGHYFDAETGLHDNRFRTYSPELGRYLQCDPSGTEGGLNLYAYTDNPLRAVDLRGYEETCPEGTKDCPFEKEGGKDKEGVKKTVSDAEPGKTLSDGSPMPPGTKKVTYSDGNHQAHYYVDGQGRTIRAEVPVKPPAEYKKRGVGHINPEGRVAS